AGDFTLDANMEWSRGEAELVPARFTVALWARRAGFQHVIDSPWARLGDLEGYRASAQQAARLGFTGKWCLHPNQVSICNEVFLPTEEQYREAKRALGVMAEALSRGEGSVMHEGRLLELPLVERARRIVELYEAAKKGDGE
ncbi:MAG: hypothetical protein IRY95_06095, partial [Clostridia bacterium]|nr:hypothetical protein [Clostridia bacterium]